MRAVLEGAISLALFPRTFLSPLAPDPAQLVCRSLHPLHNALLRQQISALCHQSPAPPRGNTNNSPGPEPKMLRVGESRHSSQSHGDRGDVNSSGTGGWKCPRSMAHRSLRKGGMVQANRQQHRDCSRTPMLTAKSIQLKSTSCLHYC